MLGTLLTLMSIPYLTVCQGGETLPGKIREVQTHPEPPPPISAPMSINTR